MIRSLLLLMTLASPAFAQTRPAINAQFVWDAECTLPDNGLTVVCPPENSTQPPIVQVSGGGIRQLPHTDIIFGSMTCITAEHRYTDWQMHGAGNWPNSPANNNERIIDHRHGRIRLIMPSKLWTIAYRIPNGPGRWRMVIDDGDSYCTSMWDFKADQYNGDVTDWADRINWMLLKAADESRPMVVDRVCKSIGFICLPHNTDLRGGGPFSKTAVIDFNMARYILKLRYGVGNYRPDVGVATEVDWWLQNGPPAIMQHPLAKHISVSNLRITGGCLNPAIDYAWPSPLYNAAEVSNLLRNSSIGSVAFMSQSGRPVDGLVVRLEDVHIHHMVGSCLLGDSRTRFITKNLILGCSVSGRISYYKFGYGVATWLYGFTRTSVARWAGPCIEDALVYTFAPPVAVLQLDRGDGQFITGLEQNPWPDNAAEKNLIGLINDQHDGVYYKDVYRGMKLHPIEINGCNLDIAGTNFSQCIAFGRGIRLTGTLKNSDPYKPASQLLTVHSNIAGSMNGLYIDVDTVNSTPCDFSFPSTTTTAEGNWKSAFVRIVNDNDAAHRPELIPPETDPTKFHEWNSRIYASSRISVGSNVTHPPHKSQFFKYTHSPGWPTQVCFTIDDLAVSSEVVPTEIVLEGCDFDNQFSQLVATSPGVQACPAGLGAKPVRVRFVNCRLNWQLPRAYRGDDFYDRQLEFITLEKCRTREENPDHVMVSEVAGSVEFAAGETEKTVSTSLMWFPKKVTTTGSTDVEIVLANPAKPTDKRRPTIRFKRPANSPAGNIFYTASVSI